MIAALLAMVVAAPSADTFEQAKEAFRSGVTAMDNGKAQEAAGWFRRSLELRESAPAWFNLGMSCRLIDDHACVVEALEKYMSTEGASSTPEMQQALQNSEQHVGRLNIKVVGNFTAVSVDGRKRCGASSPCTIVVAAGPRKVAVARPAPLPAVERTVVVPARHRETVSFDLGQAVATAPPPAVSAPPVAPPPAGAGTVATEPPDAEPNGGPPWWLWAGLGVLVVGAAATGIAVATRPQADGGSLDLVIKLGRNQ